MELKYRQNVRTSYPRMRSNRTFMELKWLKRLPFLISVSSNRTFMELKFVETYQELEGSQVLIVPLWN